MARWTGLEPATPGVTGRYSNQLSYHRRLAPGCPRRPISWTCRGITQGAKRRQAGSPMFFNDLGFSMIWCRDEFIMVRRRQLEPPMRPIARAPCLFCSLNAFFR